MANIEVTRLTCLKCGYKWIPRQQDIRMCPNCKSVNWDKPRKDK